MNLNEITLEVTQQCPNRCIYCSSLSDIEKIEAMNFDVICKVVDDAKELGAEIVSLSGGEPFLRGDLAEIVDYIYSKGLKVRVYSSGINYENGQYTPLSVTLLTAVKDKIETLIFNYETLDAELYATIMGTEAANLNLLNESINNAIALGIPVETHLVPMHCNFRQIPEVLSKIYSIGVQKVSFLRLVPQGRVLENRDMVELSEEEQQQLKQILTKSEETYKGKIRLGLPFIAKRSTCGTGSVKLTIRYDGLVFPCEAFKDGIEDIMSGVTPESVREKSLKEVYSNSAYLQAVRRGLEDFSSCVGDEYCFGQFCRRNKR